MELRRTKAATHQGGLIDALASVNIAELSGAVHELAKPRHMFRQRTENRRAAEYVADMLRACGYSVEFEGELRNVVATPPAQSDRPLILIGAH